MNKKEKVLIAAPVAALLAFAGFIYWLLIFRKEGQFKGLLPEELDFTDLLWCLLAFICASGILFVFLKAVPMKYIYDDSVRLLADSYSTRFLAVYFIPNAFAEELIFRGALQPVIGLVPATLIFTLIHVSYYKKPVILLETFCQGLILGLLFHFTGSVWITTIAHAAFNTLQTWMIKSDVIKYSA